MTFFRKYNKLLLAIGGSILMVVFLIPQAGSMLQGQAADQKIGHIGDRSITIGDKRMAAFELEVVGRALGIAGERAISKYRETAEEDSELRNAYASRFTQIQSLRASLPNERAGAEGADPALEWLLLIEEARRQGLYAAQVEIDGFLSGLGLDKREMLIAMRREGLSLSQLDQAARHFRMVLKLRSLALAPRRVSEPAIRTFVRDHNVSMPGMFGIRTGNMVETQRVKISADHAKDLIGSVSEEEIQQLFKDAADDLPGEGPYGFGYRDPARFMVEYILIGMDDIKSSLGDLTDEAMAWMARPENVAMLRAKLEAESKKVYTSDTPVDQVNPEKLPDVTPEEWDAMTLVQRFEAFRERLMEATLNQKIAERQREIVAVLRRGLNQPLASVKKDDKGYYIGDGPLPAADFEALAAKINTDMGLLPKVVRIEDRWLSEQDIAELKDLGRTYIQINEGQDVREVYAAEYVAMTREVLTDAQKDDELVNLLKLQVGVPSAFLTDDQQSICVLRVINARPSQAPASLAEVRDRVEADAKKLKAYRKLQELVSHDYLKLAQTDGLDRLVESLGEGHLKEWGGRSPRRYASVGQDGRPEIRGPRLPGLDEEASRVYADAVFDQIQSRIGSGTDIEALAKADRILAVPIDRELAVYVVEIETYDSISTSDIQLARAGVSQLIRNIDAYEISSQPGQIDPLSLGELKKRLGYTDDASEQEPNDSQEDTPKPDAAAAIDADGQTALR